MGDDEAHVCSCKGIRRRLLRVEILQYGLVTGLVLEFGPPAVSALSHIWGV